MNSIKPLGLTVRTSSGKHLGQVVDVEIDPDTQGVISYHVKPSRLLPDMVRAPLLIHHSQVIEMNANEMVVDDLDVSAAASVPEASGSTS